MKIFVSIFGALAILLGFMIIVTEVTMISTANLDPVTQSKIIDKLVFYHLIGTNLICLGFGLVIIFSKEDWK